MLLAATADRRWDVFNAVLHVALGLFSVISFDRASPLRHTESSMKNADRPGIWAEVVVAEYSILQESGVFDLAFLRYFAFE